MIHLELFCMVKQSQNTQFSKTKFVFDCIVSYENMCFSDVCESLQLLEGLLRQATIIEDVRPERGAALTSEKVKLTGLSKCRSHFSNLVLLFDIVSGNRHGMDSVLEFVFFEYLQPMKDASSFFFSFVYCTWVADARSSFLG